MLFSQTITGTVQNQLGQKIMAANLLIKDSANATQIKEFTIAQNGQYTITLKKNYKHIAIIATAINYNNEVFEIVDYNPKKNFTHNFILTKKTATELAEVTVTAKEKPFEIKDDTVKYNVRAYKDGTERKIEDIIKKLPGIEVNEKTGEIKYKGKSIETVMLDGDDLFSSNYKIGTKNINVDAVQQVQAIENYTNNPLLKGIESTDKVALNLKLKKTKVNFTGSLGIGEGINANNEMVHNTDGTILGVSKTYKSFGTISFNNVGYNNTPFDYFTYSPSIEEIKEGATSAKKIIPETFFASDLEDKRSNRNNDWFVNYTQIFKISPKVQFKNNLFFVDNIINSNQILQNFNVIDTNKFTTTDDFNIVKKAKQCRADFELKFNTSGKSSLVYNGKFTNENINTNAIVQQNFLTNFSTKLTSFENKNNQSLLFTNRLKDNKALQISINYASSKIPQNYLLNPSVFNTLIYNNDEQMSSLGKTIFNTQATFLASTPKAKYTFSIGSNSEKNVGETYLICTNSNSKTNDTIAGFKNNFNYNANSIYNKAAIIFFCGKWKITTEYSLNMLHQKWSSNINNLTLNNKKFVFEPSVTIKRKLNDISGIMGKIGITNKPFTEEYLYANPVYANNRILVNNQIDLRFQKNFTTGLFYLLNDMFKQFRLNASVDYNISNGSYFANNNIQENVSSITNFYLPTNTTKLNINFLIDKYINKIESTIKLKIIYSVSNYINKLNGSALRNNETKFLSNELFFKTAFNKKINFENISTLNNAISKNDVSNPLANNGFINTFKIIYRPSKTFILLLGNDYYLPNLNQEKQSYSFIDLSFRYTPKHKKYDLSFAVKNINDVNCFRQVTVNDFSTNTFQSNLLERYVLLNISFNF